MRLSLGNGPLPRLLAPGVPDWIGADGARIGWALRDVIFWLEGGAVSTLRLPDLVEDVAAAGGKWTAATALGALALDPATAAVGRSLSVDQGEPLAVVPGADCVLVQAVPEHTLVRLDRGTAVPIPDAATRARWAAPFAAGVGLVWVDLDLLYRLRDGGIPQALGRAPGAQALAVGPDGATLLALADDTLCVGPRALPARLGHAVDVEGARFSPDGTRALVADEEGVAEIDLLTAKELRRWDGALAPVGYAPGPVRWDRAAGTLLDEADRVVLRGLAGATPAFHAPLLAGPGGATWSVESGAVVHEPLGEGVAATDGRRVVVVDAHHVRVTDGASFVHGLVQGDDEVDVVRLAADEVQVQTLDGAAAAFALDGAERWRKDEGEVEPVEERLPAGVQLTDPSEPSAVTVRGTEWPLPADGAAERAGEVWVWSTEGLLVAVG